MHAAILTEELGWHRTGWAIRLGHCDSISKVFLSDPSGKNADLVSQAVGDKLGGVYSSPAELLEEHKIQIAVVTMAPSRMPDAVLAALEAGANVLVEKPGAASPDAYAPLVELANARGLLLTMALIADSPVVREAARIVSEGTLGRIYGINYLSMDHQRWRRRHDFGWVFSRAQSGGGDPGPPCVPLPSLHAPHTRGGDRGSDGFCRCRVRGAAGGGGHHCVVRPFCRRRRGCSAQRLLGGRLPTSLWKRRSSPSAPRVL